MSATGRKIWEFLEKQGKSLARSFCYDPYWPKIKAFFTEKRWARIRIISGVALAGLVVGLMILPSTGYAAGDFGAGFVGGFIAAIAQALSSLLEVIGKAFNYVVKGDGPFGIIIGNDAVRVGWTATRDVCNLGFVLILLGIGFATILRVPTYHVKKLIIPFIVALLLINFSKLICGVITDFTHVIMASFAAAMTGSSNYSGSLAQSIGVQDWIAAPQATGNETWGWVANLIIICLFLVALSFAFLLIVVLLIVRWITLVILTIFSPIVYAAQILPTTKSFAKKWWQQFLQNAFYGPVAVFMVYLALVIAKGATFKAAGSPTAGASNFLTVEALIGLVVVCVLLYKAVTMSRSMGIAGAGAVISTGTKWGKKGLGAVGVGLGTVTGIRPAYQAVSQRVGAAWGARQKAQKEKRQESGVRMGLATKGWMDRTRQKYGKGTPFGRETELQRRAKAQQEQNRAGDEKKVADAMRPQDMSSKDLDDKVWRGTPQEQLAAAMEQAKRGELKRTDYNRIKGYNDLSRAGRAAMTDAMVAADPMADIDTTRLAAGDAVETEKLRNRVKKLDMKKVSANAVNGKNAGAPELLNMIAKERGKDALVGIHKDLGEDDKKKMGKQLQDSVSGGQGIHQKDDTYKNLVGASLAVNKALPVDSSGNLNLNDKQIKEMTQEADAKDLSIALLKPEGIGAMDSGQQKLIAKSLTQGKLKQMADIMGTDPKFNELMKSKRAAHPVGTAAATPMDGAIIKSLDRDMVLRNYGK